METGDTPLYASFSRPEFQFVAVIFLPRIGPLHRPSVVTRHDKEITATAISIHPSRISVLFINDAALLIAPGLNLAAY